MKTPNTIKSLVAAALMIGITGLGSCKKNNLPEGPVKETHSSATIAPDCGELTTGSPEKGSYPEIVNAAMSGDNLKLTISYSGCGANPNDIELLWDESYEPGFPPTATLVVHKKTVEPCKAVIEHGICFNIRKVKDANNGEPVRIKIKGWDGELFY